MFTVISSLNDPVKGWLDNLNGPFGLLMASGKGIIRITIADKSIKPDYMAVDISIKSMIVAAWHRAKLGCVYNVEFIFKLKQKVNCNTIYTYKAFFLSQL